MPARTPRRRPLVAAAATLAALALTLTACASDDGAAEPEDTAAAGSGAFPVTIESALGEAVIEEAPERVVTLGWGSGDIAFSLGVVPVGVEEDAWGGDEDGYQPWLRAAIEEQGGELPETIQMYPELEVEKIVGLEPDLILAPQSGLEQDVFDQLSEFAPVVAYPGEPWQTTIEDQVRIAAEALGVPEKADEVLAEREAALTEAAAAHPEFAGKTFAYVYGGTPGTLSVYLPGDTRVSLLTGLGLELAPSVAGLTASEGTFAATLGLENADQLADADVLFTWFNDTAEQQATEAQPLWQQIPAFQRGSYLPMVDTTLGMAVSVASPLSIPWALDTYVPQIAEAVAAVPAS